MNTRRSKNYGKYGLIHLSDLVIHRIEFNAWYTEIKKKNIKAKFDNGLLTLSIPKVEPKEEKEQNNYIAIEG